MAGDFGQDSPGTFADRYEVFDVVSLPTCAPWVEVSVSFGDSADTCVDVDEVFDIVS